MSTISKTITTGVTLATTGSYSSPLTITSQGYVSDIGDAIFGPGGQAWTVANYGLVRSTDGNGIRLRDGGLVTNASGGTIGGRGDGILIENQAGSVINAGAITGTQFEGIYLNAGGLVSNASTGVISGADEGIYAAYEAATITNAGTITASVFEGVYLSAGGSVGNSGGLIEGHQEGVRIVNQSGTVGNSGAITGGAAPGVYLGDGGAVVNSGGMIQGSGNGIYIGASAGTVNNSGVIRGLGSHGVGVTLGAGGTVINDGTIEGAGGTAIAFGGSGANRLVLDPGYRLIGAVAGSTSGGATNTLELGSAAHSGAVTGLGTAISHFATLLFDSGARWTAEGSAAGLPATIDGFTAGDTIDVDGFVAAGRTYTGSALVLTDTASNSVTLGIHGTFSTSDFVVASDDHGGTEVTIAAADTSVPSEMLGGPYSGAENSLVPLGGVTVAVSPNADDPLSVTLSVASGTLSAGGQSGASIILGGKAAMLDAALGGLVYSGAANFYGADTLSVTTSDTADGSSTANSTSITLSDTSVPSEMLGGPYSGAENSAVPLGGVTVAVGPNGDDPLSVTLSVASGTLSAGGQSGAAITLGGTAAMLDAVLGGLVYSGAANFYGADTLSVTTSDTVDQNTTTANVAIEVDPNPVTVGPGNHAVAFGNGDMTVTLGPGSDDVTGGNGNDVITAEGGAGNDRVGLGNGNDTVTLANGNNTVTLGGGNDTVTVGNGNNNIMIAGSAGSIDSISAGNGDNMLMVGAGTYRIALGNGDNIVDMDGGTYNVTAGHGTDLFVFETPQALLDLKFGGSDALVFRNSGFDFGSFNGTGTSIPQHLPASLFSPNADGTFTSADQRFAYNQATGDLYYDAQGNAQGSTAYLVAHLTNAPHLTAGGLYFTK